MMVGSPASDVDDQFTHECLAIRINRKSFKAIDVIDVLSDLFILRRVPGHIRSDNGPDYRQSLAGFDCGHGCQDRLHRTWRTRGKTVCRKF